MALGNSNYNNNKDDKSKNSPSLYSNYKMSNTESTIDKTNLSFTYWNGTLKLALAPMNISSGSDISFDHKNAIGVYLTHTKARMLFDEIVAFQADPVGCNNNGVASGAGLVSISNGKEFGINNPCLILRKVNPETGMADATFVYEFKVDYHYAIRNYDEASADFDKVFYNNLEIEQLKTLLITYYESQSGAMAYSVLDAFKYQTTRAQSDMDSVKDKLGIEGYKGGNSGKSSQSAFNSREPRNSFSQGSYDNIKDQME